MSRGKCRINRVWLPLLLALLSACKSSNDDDDKDKDKDEASVEVGAEIKIAEDLGGFEGSLADGDEFGGAVAAIGDLGGGRSLPFNLPEQDGVDDLAVGAPGDDTGSLNAGAVWILFMDPDGEVDDERRIASDTAGFDVDLFAGDRFGSAVAPLEDLDGDGIDELVAGAPGDNGTGVDQGALWVLFMERDGRVREQQKISDDEGDLDTALEDDDAFGSALARLPSGAGDFNTDNIDDLLVGLPGRDAGGANRGAVWILHLATDGRVVTKERISGESGEFDGELNNGDEFGSAIAVLGDLDNDGVVDLAVGAPGDDDSRGTAAGVNRGAVWILFMNSDGTVGREAKISDDEGGFTGKLANGDRFGSSLAAVGDLDGDGNEDIAVGAPGDLAGTTEGSVWILFLDEDGKVLSEQQISFEEGGFQGVLDAGDAFGAAIADIGDFDLEGSTDLAVGAPGDDRRGPERGALWLLFLDEPR